MPAPASPEPTPAATRGATERARARPRAPAPTDPSRFAGTERTSSPRGPGDGNARGRGTNGRRATTAAMRNGCRRGEAFEGCERAAGEPARFRPPHRSPASPPGPGTGERSVRGKRGEPQVRDRAATCPGPMVGGNRRGGAKPRGRNRTPRCGSRRPKVRARERAGREWTTTGSHGEERTPVRRSTRGTEEGHTKDESQERQEASGSARGRALPAERRER